MLNNFFSINLPYGIARNSKGEWMAFNREYMPLGYNDESFKGKPGAGFLEMPIYTGYKKITEKLLKEIAFDEKGIHRDVNGEIVTVFLYNDGTNPVNQLKEKKELWESYFEKLKKLSKFKKK